MKKQQLLVFSLAAISALFLASCNHGETSSAEVSSEEPATTSETPSETTSQTESTPSASSGDSSSSTPASSSSTLSSKEIALTWVPSKYYTVSADSTTSTAEITYTDMAGAKYNNLKADLTTADAYQAYAFSVQIQNKGTAAVNFRGDVNAEATHGTHNITAINTSATAKDSNGADISVTSDLDWGGSTFSLAAGVTATFTINFTGTAVSLQAFMDSSIYKDTATHTGDVVLSHYTMYYDSSIVVPVPSSSSPTSSSTTPTSSSSTPEAWTETVGADESVDLSNGLVGDTTNTVAEDTANTYSASTKSMGVTISQDYGSVYLPITLTAAASKVLNFYCKPTLKSGNGHVRFDFYYADSTKTKLSTTLDSIGYIPVSDTHAVGVITPTKEVNGWYKVALPLDNATLLGTGTSAVDVTKAAFLKIKMAYLAAINYDVASIA